MRGSHFLKPRSPSGDVCLGAPPCGRGPGQEAGGLGRVWLQCGSPGLPEQMSTAPVSSPTTALSKEPGQALGKSKVGGTGPGNPLLPSVLFSFILMPLPPPAPSALGQPRISQGLMHTLPRLSPLDPHKSASRKLEMPGNTQVGRTMVWELCLLG